MFLQLRYAIGRLHYAFFEKNTMKNLKSIRWNGKYQGLWYTTK